jgi:hypothetical protein
MHLEVCEDCGEEVERTCRHCDCCEDCCDCETQLVPEEEEDGG